MSPRFSKDATGIEASSVLDTPESKRPSPQATQTLIAPRTKAILSPASDGVATTNGSQSAEQKILNALSALEQLNRSGPGSHKKSNVAFFAGYVENWRFEARIADLREKGLIEIVGPGEIALTRDGRAVADATLSIRTLGELHDTWLAKLPEAEANVLRILLGSHGPVERAAIAAALNRKENWRFDGVLNQLKQLGIIDLPDKRIVALTGALFPAGLS
jgi:hypothetical protein